MELIVHGKTRTKIPVLCYGPSWTDEARVLHRPDGLWPCYAPAIPMGRDEELAMLEELGAITKRIEDLNKEGAL